MDISIIIHIILLILGFVFLIKGSDFFVEGSSSIASILKIPTIIVGLTVVAFGTSAPEAAVSVTSSVIGSNAIAVSNVIGSNLFNILFIIGLCALLNELKIEKNIIIKDIPFLVVVTILTSLFIIFNWNISRLEGIILLLIVISYVSYLIISALKSNESKKIEKTKLTFSKSVICIVVGVIGIILGADLVVKNASSIAITLGMSETLVGLTIVAIGTSLPELVTSLTALKKGENQLVIGNVIGSNIFNLLFILGLSSTINPISLSSNMLLDICLMIFITILCLIFGKTQEKFDKKEGFILVGLFILYMIFVILRN